MSHSKGPTALDPGETDYPTWDSEPMESEAHVMALITTVEILRQYFRNRPDVYVIGNLFWFYEEGNPKARICPDVMVAKGVDASRKGRYSWKSWVEKSNPCFILELTSIVTAEEDTNHKIELYERLGVREYFLFDPRNELLERPLMGYHLINGRYEPLTPAEDGGVLSAELGLRLVPDGPSLILVESRTNQRLPGLVELADELDRLRDQIRQLDQALVERNSAEEARKRIEAAESRVRELEAELERLRRGGSSSSPNQPGDPS